MIISDKMGKINYVKILKMSIIGTIVFDLLFSFLINVGFTPSTWAIGESYMCSLKTLFPFVLVQTSIVAFISFFIVGYIFNRRE